MGLRFKLLCFFLAALLQPSSFHYNVRRKFADGNLTDDGVSSRVHGGLDTSEGQFRYMVLLLVSRDMNLHSPTLTCSASLIDDRWVLTAAHCVVPKPNPVAIIAVAGKADLRQYYLTRMATAFDMPVPEEFLGVQERRVQEIFIQPGYNPRTNENDVALLYLDRSFVIGDQVRTVQISPVPMMYKKECTVMGWGLNEQQKQTFRLMHSNVLAGTPQQKHCRYIGSGPYICLERGGPGICKGDSGSPLICENSAWGVSSFALSQQENPPCGGSEEEYYSELYPHRRWINFVMDKPPSRAVAAGRPLLPLILFAASLNLVLRML